MKGKSKATHFDRQRFARHLFRQRLDSLHELVGLYERGTGVIVRYELYEGCSGRANLINTCSPLFVPSGICLCDIAASLQPRRHLLCIHRPTPVRLLPQYAETVEGALPIIDHHVVQRIVPLLRHQLKPLSRPLTPTSTEDTGCLPPDPLSSLHPSDHVTACKLKPDARHETYQAHMLQLHILQLQIQRPLQTCNGLFGLALRGMQARGKV